MSDIYLACECGINTLFIFQNIPYHYCRRFSTWECVQISILFHTSAKP